MIFSWFFFSDVEFEVQSNYNNHRSCSKCLNRVFDQFDLELNLGNIERLFSKYFGSLCIARKAHKCFFFVRNTPCDQIKMHENLLPEDN